MKHIYPKNRKRKDILYSKSSRLVAQLGVDKVREVLSKMGQYRASVLFTELTGWYVSPYVIYYLRKFVLKMEAYGNEKVAV